MYKLKIFRILYAEIEKVIKEIKAEEETRAKERKGGALNFKDRNNKSIIDRRIGIGRIEVELNLLISLIIEDIIKEIIIRVGVKYKKLLNKHFYI